MRRQLEFEIENHGSGSQLRTLMKVLNSKPSMGSQFKNIMSFPNSESSDSEFRTIIGALNKEAQAHWTHHVNNQL